MEFLNSWVQGIVTIVAIATIVEMILPNGNNKKYVKMVLGIYIVFTIISPIVNKITNNNFEISSMINLNKYEKQFETFEVSSKSINMENTNESNIKKIYIANLEKDMNVKLKEKGYIVNKIDIEINTDMENENKYEINKVLIEINSNKKEIEDNNRNINIVNEIQIVNINVKKNEEKNIDSTTDEINKNDSKVTHSEKTEIIKYISDTYGVDEKNITIY